MLIFESILFQQSYANTSSLIPNYGKVLRLDSSGALNPSKLTPAATPVTPGTSPLGAALTHPFNPFTNGATGIQMTPWN